MQKDSQSVKNRPLTVQLPAAAVESLKKSAASQERSVSAVVRIAISHYLKALSTGGIL